MKTLKKTLCLLVLSGLIMSVLNAQLDSREKGLESITIDVVKSQLEFLASDWTEGRGTGQKGIYLAGDYIASIFKVYGLLPGGDFEWTRLSRSERMRGVKPEKTRSYFQNFSLIEYYHGEDHEFSLISQNSAGKQILKFAYRTDFTVNTSDVGTEITAPVVFVGYGLVDIENNYDDFKGVDVKGKIILRLSGYPGHKDTTSNAYKKFHPKGPYGSYYLSREKTSQLKNMVLSVLLKLTRMVI